MTRHVSDIGEQANLFKADFRRVHQEISKVIVGYSDLIDDILMTILGKGHVLLEGVPGLGKTKLVQTLSNALHLQSSRIQFTPDLMPADIVGTNVVQENEHGDKFLDFQPGPVFGKNDVGEDRTRLEVEELIAVLVFLNDVGPDDIGRHQVRSELDSRRSQVQPIAQGLNQLGLSQARHSFQQHVAFSKDGHQNVIDHIGISDNDLRNFLMHPAEFRLERIHLAFKIRNGISHYSLLPEPYIRKMFRSGQILGPSPYPLPKGEGY